MICERRYHRAFAETPTSPAALPPTQAATMPAILTGETWKIRTVLPSDTDAEIDSFTGNGWTHCVYYNPDAARRNQLVVYLPGTGGKGTSAVRFNSCAADLGFDVVSLAYPSTIGIIALRESDDPDAFAKARSNIVYGTAPIAMFQITPSNSIENRLVKLLEYLAKTYPNEDWGQYLDGHGSVVWGKLVLVGQSQGGGHAPFIAKQHEVARVLMFAAPKEFNTHFNQPAKWFSDPSATPIDRYFSFVHVDDGHDGCTYPQQLENYHALGLMPKYAIVNVDETEPPYEHSRLLTSTRPSKFAHGAPVGNPMYERAWIYMLTEPAGAK